MEIKVGLSSDKMGAFISCELKQDIDEASFSNYVNAALKAKGVKGILKGIMPKAYQVLKTKGKLENALVSKGKEAKKTIQPQINSTYSIMDNPEDIKFIKALKASGELSASGMSSKYPDAEWPLPGVELGAIKQGEAGENGVDVLGNPLPCEVLLPPDKILGKNLALEGESILAGSEGVFIKDGNVYSIIKFDDKPGIKIEFSEKNLEALLTLSPAQDGNTQVNLDDVILEIRNLKIINGIKKDAIQEALAQFKESKKSITGHVIARGVPPRNGLDGKTTILINVEEGLKPGVDDKGQADFKKVDFFIQVKANQKIAQLIPPTRGRPGQDVFGSNIPSSDGHPARLPNGLNTATTPDGFLISQIDGVLVKTDGLFKVDPLLRIPGDVDYNTGSVEFDGSVNVGGDVKSGFNIISQGNVEVHGCVEDSNFKAKGNVLIHQGFTGQGQGFIECGGSFNAGFIHNQKVKASGDVTIFKELFDGDVYSHNIMRVNGNPVSIVGGHAAALVAIEANTIGNEHNMATKVEVGKDYRQQGKADALNAKTEYYRKKLEFLVREKTAMEKDKKFLGKLPPEQETLLARTLGMIQKLNNSTKQMEIDVKGLLENIYYKGQCRISAKKVYPGTMIIIRDTVLKVTQEMEGKTFFLKGKQIAF